MFNQFGDKVFPLTDCLGEIVVRIPNVSIVDIQFSTLGIHFLKSISVESSRQFIFDENHEKWAVLNYNRITNNYFSNRGFFLNSFIISRNKDFVSYWFCFTYTGKK